MRQCVNLHLQYVIYTDGKDVQVSPVKQLFSYVETVHVERSWLCNKVYLILHVHTFFCQKQHLRVLISN